MSLSAAFGSGRVARVFRARPVAMLVTITTALALVAGAVVVVGMRDQMTAEADARLARHANEQASAVDEVVTAATRDLRLASRNIAFPEALAGGGANLTPSDRAAVEAAIRYTGERYAVDEICLIRADGVETARYNGGEIAAVDDLSPDESIGNPAFFPAMALAEDEVYRTEPYISPDSNRWVFGLATPIFAGGKAVGILHFELPVAAFSEALAARAFGPGGYTFVLTNDGRLLAHPQIDVFRQAAGLPTDTATADFPPAISAGSPGWRQAIGHILAGASTGGFDDGAVATRFVAQPMLDGSASAVTVTPERELYADVDRAQLNLLVTVGPLAVLIVLLTGWFARRLSNSNRKLAATMQTSAELASIVASADDAILSVDRDGRVVTWNDGAQRAFGLTRSEAIGKAAIELFDEDHREEAAAHLEASALGEVVDRFETVISSATGEGVDALLTFSPVRASDGSLSGLSIIARDISARKRLEEQLEHQALHDSLTGLPNRALFRDRLDHALARRTRPMSTALPGAATAVLFIDLDDFKVINDTLGHRIGDELLIEVGRRINSAIRPGDTAARLGGDEFTVLLEGLGDATEARVIADRVLRALAPGFQLESHDVVVSASIGIVVTSDDHAGPDELLRSADTALYEAKAKGKGQHQTYHAGMSEKAWHRLELETELRRAIAESELVVEYQPIVELGSGRIRELEALVRWRHPERGLVPPSDFIPLAEQTGLIVQIGEFVLATAARDLAAWRASRPDMANVRLSVNLSPRELRRSDLVESITGALAAAGLVPGDLRVEITEGIQLDDAASITLLRELRERGVSVSIDDFGTGYSSLSSFRTMPIDGLKLDRVFVAALGKATEETAIITAAIAFGAALGIEVTAEGIETDEQLAMLRDLGCQLGQGFLMSRPVSAASIGDLAVHLTVKDPRAVTDRGAVA
jgi:diguanylate cyclase (GGDEF)-like protein/PAS domain S-box-containing protein